MQDRLTGSPQALNLADVGSNPTPAIERNYHAEWYERNKVERRKQVGERRDRLRREGREYVNEYLKTHGCVDCPESDIVALDFDHVRGIKKQAVTTLVASAYSIAVIQAEIDKCEVRCSNCHRKRHARERESGFES